MEIAGRTAQDASQELEMSESCNNRKLTFWQLLWKTIENVTQIRRRVAKDSVFFRVVSLTKLERPVYPAILPIAGGGKTNNAEVNATDLARI